MASPEEDDTNKKATVFGFVWRCIASSRLVFSNANANDWTRMARGISCPVSAKDAMGRLRYNLRDFAPNYQVLMLLSMAISVVFRPWSFLTLFGIIICWHYVINVRSKDIAMKRAANEEPIVVTVRTQGMILLLLSAILIFGFTSFSATFMTCVSVGAGVCISHSVMKAPLTDTTSSDGSDSGSSPSLLAEFQEYTGSTLSTFNRGAGFEKVIPSQVYEYGGKAFNGATAGVSTISSYFGQAIMQRTNSSGGGGGGNASV
jgi:hypothetical protein